MALVPTLTRSANADADSQRYVWPVERAVVDLRPSGCVSGVAKTQHLVYWSVNGVYQKWMREQPVFVPFSTQCNGDKWYQGRAWLLSDLTYCAWVEYSTPTGLVGSNCLNTSISLQNKLYSSTKSAPITGCMTAGGFNHCDGPYENKGF